MPSIRTDNTGTAVLIGASRLLRPVLAGGAIVLLLIIVPGRSPHPAIRTARVFLGDALDVRAEWLRWSLLQEHPAPAELIYRLPELPPPLAGTAP
ncbi:MAG: hypothetical protein ACN0LA_10805 [Candidatus Longimicrobiales bacterium M2_2A_002]